MFLKIRPDSWESTRSLGRQLLGWGFRGHSDANWKLVTTFERAADIYGYPAERRLEREALMLKHFKRRAHFYITAPPAIEDELEWLALIQHYGGPTRLLDFSRSFYVSAFFAVERSEKDAAVWAINLNGLEESRDLSQYYLDVKSSSPKVQKVAKVEPERMNQRLSIQQGFFLFPFDISTSFIDNLAGTFNVDPQAFSQVIAEEPCLENTEGLDIAGSKIVQVILRRETHRAALSDLKAMNVTSETLFPGLDGFARSLYFQLTLKA
jgi:hypothetical protein